MGSSFGTLFRISTFGESHGGGVGVILEGCPPRLELDLLAIQAELDRRRPGQSKITTPRKEADQVEILSGVMDGITLGTPIAMVVRNKDQRPQDYKEVEVAFRPSHADATYQAKYGIQARPQDIRDHIQESHVHQVRQASVQIGFQDNRFQVDCCQEVDFIKGSFENVFTDSCKPSACEEVAEAHAAVVGEPRPGKPSDELPLEPLHGNCCSGPMALK